MTASGTSRTGLLAGLVAPRPAGSPPPPPAVAGDRPPGLARGLVDASPAMLVDGGVALVGRADKPRRCVRAGPRCG